MSAMSVNATVITCLVLCLFLTYYHLRCAGGHAWSAGLVISRPGVRISPTATVYQCNISVPSLWGRLMSTSESWGVNQHTTRCSNTVSA